MPSREQFNGTGLTGWRGQLLLEQSPTCSRHFPPAYRSKIQALHIASIAERKAGRWDIQIFLMGLPSSPSVRRKGEANYQLTWNRSQTSATRVSYVPIVN